MSVRVYRIMMNAVMLAATAYWILVLHRLIFDSVSVISMQLRLDGYLLMFLGAVLVITGLAKSEEWTGDERNKFPALEVTYWVINCIAFLVVFGIGAIG